MLRIPLSSLAGDDIVVRACVPGEALRPDEAKALRVGMVAVSGTLSATGVDYVFRGCIEGAYEAPCDRCLDPAKSLFGLDVTWVYTTEALEAKTDSGEVEVDVPSLEAEAEAGIVCIVGDVIDLQPQVWEEIALNAPSKILCKDTCAGLCPMCGANLNHGSCGCRETQSMENRGLAGLADALDHLKAQSSEE